MDDLYKAGFGFVIRTSTVSVSRDHQMTFWECACPLWWVGPSWSMDTIVSRGNFYSKEHPVLAQEKTLKKLLSVLLDKANSAFPNPYELPNGGDSRKISHNIYYHNKGK